ncbi:MAG: FAD-dependent oxidoreductase [Planctomycetaceae bacterium]|nr:FAD-dependent oxidoreductase [Planctomycetaceae bacterium]
MKRRQFLQTTATAGLLLGSSSLQLHTEAAESPQAKDFSRSRPTKELAADLVVLGGGLGGCATALAALRNGLRVVWTEETDWIGGQITSQGVPPDEHPWIETHGSPRSYREFRTAIRNYYKNHYPLTDDAKNRPHLNPGDGNVSRICHEPRVTLAVLYQMFNPYLSMGKLTLLLEHKAFGADVEGDRIKSVAVRNLREGNELVLSAPYFVDATELGDLLPISGTEFRTGAESFEETGELHAAKKADPNNQQAFTVCFIMDYDPKGEHLIEKPAQYGFWRNFVPEMTPPYPGKLLSMTYNVPSTLQTLTLGFHPDGGKTEGPNMWNYRRIVNKNNFLPGTYVGDATVVNWPQNDYLLGNLDGSDEEFQKHLAQAKQLSLSLFYWLQTEIPRPDGKNGWPGLRLRGDMLGTTDGLAKYPYIRESRRIEAVFTVLEEHVGKEQREKILGKPATLAAPFHDSVGLGYYQIDLHPSTGGDNYIDFPSLRYQIPLGALLPKRMVNLLPANKNIGTTHVTNGNFRLHPTEWGIGEAVGSLVHFVLQKQTIPRAVREKSDLLAEYQDFLRTQGIETDWPE